MSDTEEPFTSTRESQDGGASALLGLPSRQAPLKILVADDTFASRQLLVRMLRQHVRAHVHEARHGLEAVQEFRALRPQITFLDIDMPEMDGMAVLEEIRGIEHDGFVVMVSAHGSLKKVQDALSLGVDGFVVKPFSGQRILDVLNKYAAKAGRDGLVRPE